MPRINEAFLNLRASYLFAEIKRRTQAHRDAHPGARLIGAPGLNNWVFRAFRYTPAEIEAARRA